MRYRYWCLILLWCAACHGVAAPILPPGVEENPAVRDLVRRLFLRVGGEQEAEPVVVMGKAAILDATAPLPSPPPHEVETASSGGRKHRVLMNDRSAGPTELAGGRESPVPSPQSLATEVCGPAPMLPVKVCEVGASFLCVDTPPGGVTEEQVTVRGLVDRRGSAVTGMKIVAQHEATKGFQEVATMPALTDQCRTRVLTAAQPFCLDADGAFAVRVSLTQLGPYAIGVQAFRGGGDPMLETVHVSRVVAPTIAPEAVALEPNPATSDRVVDAERVTVTVDLLPRCEHCDVIGSGTGGTTVTVVNTIVIGDSASQQIVRTTNQGSDGKYTLCVPIGGGENRLDLRACNAATGFDPTHCPHVTLPSFRGSVSPVRLRMTWPEGMQTPIFSHRDYPALIPVTFALEGWAGVCAENSVTLEWNREAPVALCPEGGVFHTTVVPQPGVNLGVVHVRQGTATDDFPFTVGWGELHSPWAAAGQLKAPEANWYLDAMVLGVRQAFVAETLRDLINHVAASEQLDAVVRRLVDQPNGTLPAAPSPLPTAPSMAERLPVIRKEIPHCGAGATTDGPFSDMRTRLVQPPTIGGFEITSIRFAPDVAKFTIELRDVSAVLQLYRDQDHDQVPDYKALPLRIAFRKLVLSPEVRLVRGAPPIVLLTAADDDCDYKNGSYCTQRPSLVVPKHFVGGATPLGGFVLCDHEGQIVDASIAEGCKGLNILNAQTGLFSETVLDAVNTAAYCDGSAALTYLLREGFQDLRFALHPMPGRAWEFPLGLDLVHSIFTLNERGMSARVASRVGAPDFFSALPPALQVPTTAVLDDPGPPRLPADQGLSDTRDITLAVAEGFVNQLLFLLALQGDRATGTGAFDWDLHEVFFAQELGFDFTAECDAFVPTPAQTNPPTFCNMRPRVAELLGTALTTAGYFPPKQPLMLRLRGDRALSPRVRFYRGQGLGAGDQGLGNGDQSPVPSPQPPSARQIIELQIPNLEIGLYALATDAQRAPDAYGNLPLQLDAAGQPRILSMRPTDPEPANGAIIRFTVTVLLAMEVSDFLTDPLDPARWMVTIKTNPHLSRLGFHVPHGGNATLVKDASLLSAFREKLLYGLTIYGNDRDAIRFGFPKRWLFAPAPGPQGDLLQLLGLGELRIGKEGLQLAVDAGQDYLGLGLNLLMQFKTE